MIPDGTPAEEVVIVIAIAIFVGFGLVFLLFWLTRPKVVGSPKDEGSPAPANAGSPAANSIMSIIRPLVGSLVVRASRLVKGSAQALQPIATACNDDKIGLAGQGVDDLAAKGLDDITPAEARAIIRQQARAEAIVSILNAAAAGKIKSAGDQAALLEAVSGSSRTSRTNSPYTHLKVIVDELRGKEGAQYRKLDEQHRTAGM